MYTDLNGTFCWSCKKGIKCQKHEYERQDGFREGAGLQQLEFGVNKQKREFMKEKALKNAE